MPKAPFILLLSFVLCFPLVQGATVTLAPRNSSTNPGVTLKEPYGYANVTITEVFANNPTTYANGTIFFDYRSQELIQGTYDFQVKSYGNGTLVLRFKGATPDRIIQSAATSAYDSTNLWQQFTYTASQTSELTLMFNNPKFSFLNASFFSALMITLLIVGRLGFMIAERRRNEPYFPPEKMRKFNVLVIVFLVISTVFFFASLLFR